MLPRRTGEASTSTPAENTNDARGDHCLASHGLWKSVAEEVDVVKRASYSAE
jgi:hypothetical protein